jgi:neurotransmitter:Na+ symporter, NSS family
MAKFDFSKRDSFGSQLGIIAAAAGSAIGLGNIWRFPYVAGENGGGAFLFIYIFFILVIGIPVMLSEFVIGRSTQRNPFGAFRMLKPGQPWYLVGLMGILAAFMILAFYSTVAGWTLEYLMQAFNHGFDGKSTKELSDMFEGFYQSGLRPVLWQLLFLVLTAWIIWRGVKNGIEKYTKILMPVLLVIIVVISIRSLTLPGAMAGIEFMFKPDFSKINTNVVLQALGQAFFSLSIGMGTLITYGSYIRKKENLSFTAFAVSAADTLIAILAGVAILPAVFAFGIDADAGPGLVFITLPNIFQQMAGGYFWALLFFILLAVAALTSTVSILEVVVAYLTEELNISRKVSTIAATVGVAILGILCTLSQGPAKSLKFFDKDLFDHINNITANFMLPLGGLFIVTFVGWFMDAGMVKAELSNNGKLKVRLFGALLFVLKYLAPVAILLMLIFYREA